MTPEILLVGLENATTESEDFVVYLIGCCQLQSNNQASGNKSGYRRIQFITGY